MTRALLVLGVVASLAVPVRAQELHGADSILATPDVVIVWGILRAADEKDTQVVIRILAAPRFGAVSVDAVDPFSGRRQPVISARSLTGELDIRRRRAEFADSPRLEVHLHPRDAAGVLTVYYLGVPDTTSEFIGEPALLGYLEQSVARARGR
jgi:hypothetical protein